MAEKDEKKQETTAEKQENNEKKFSKRVNQLIALSALFLAICATFASLKAGGYGNKAILAQNQASNGWAYYQSKSLKENTYKVQIDHMKMNPSLDEAQKTKVIEKYQSTIDRYKAEEKEISEQAKAAEALRDKCLGFQGRFAGALTYLQIAILLVSLAALVKQLYFWYIGLGVGAIGAFYFITTLLDTL